MGVSRKLIFFLAWLVYLFFVIYGSLIPFDYQPQRLDDAWLMFRQLPFLNVGTFGRADQVANLLLYIPLSAFLFGFLKPRVPFVVLTFIVVVITLVICSGAAIAIEFVQIFFPPRTVSLNDIVAEIGGSTIGIALWLVWGEKFSELSAVIFGRGANAPYAALVFYLVAYLAFSLFPFDFLLSAAEFRVKLAGDNFHWLLSRSTCGPLVRCTPKLILEAVAVVPIGILLSLIAQRKGRHVVRSAVITGLAIGLTIETLQLFLFSGICQGASILTRVIGIVIGAKTLKSLRGNRLRSLTHNLRPLIPIVGTFYIFGLTLVTWSNKGTRLTLEEGIGRLKAVHFVPFFYHYYTSEPAAMFNLIGSVAMFAPVGVGSWLWRFGKSGRTPTSGLILAGFWGGIVAFVVEFGKLFFSLAHPDPTNVWVGVAAAGCGYAICSWSAPFLLRARWTEP